ncbi:hypothetical protein BGZ95_007922, partial [Linnemannia exigua]
EDIMSYMWTYLGGNQVEQETYRHNLALLKIINDQSKMAGGRLQWILLKLAEYEGELKELWEGMVEAGMVAAEEGDGWGSGGSEEKAKKVAGASPSSDHKAGVYKKEKYSLQDEIEQIKKATIELKAKRAQVNGKI